jgi:hypothetical protein
MTITGWGKACTSASAAMGCPPANGEDGLMRVRSGAAKLFFALIIRA